MNYRPLLLFAAIAAIICIVAFWYVQTTPPPAPLPQIAIAPSPATPAATIPAAARNSVIANDAPEMPTTSAPPPELAEWEYKIDQAIKANPDNSDAGNTATALTLINLLPTFPPEGQAEAASHITNLLGDKDYAKVMPLLKNPALPELVLDVFFTDLMNRDDATKLPAMLDVAKIPNHPNREEAANDLQIFLDQDFGTDWPKWDAALKEYLRKQALENAEAAPAK